MRGAQTWSWKLRNFSGHENAEEEGAAGRGGRRWPPPISRRATLWTESEGSLRGGLRHVERRPAESHARRRAAVMRRRTRRPGLWWCSMARARPPRGEEGAGGSEWAGSRRGEFRTRVLRNEAPWKLGSKECGEERWGGDSDSVTLGSNVTMGH